AVRESIQIEIAAELAVDPDEEVAVEGRGHAERIVVRANLAGLVLHQIDADEKRVAGAERGAHAAEQRSGSRRIEVADVRSQEQEQRAARSRTRRDLGEARFIRRLVPDD